MRRKVQFIVYVHVEKAGGISINNMLHHYIKGYISPSPEWGEVMKAKDLAKIQKYYPINIRGLGGHRVSPIESYADQQFLFSFIREPLSRLISHLNWQIHRMGIQHSLYSFVQNPYFQNFQTFRLTRTRNFKEAKKIIGDRFDFVGLSEQYDLSINLLSLKLCSEVEYFNYERMNKTKSEDKTYHLNDLSDQQLKLIQRLNQVDVDIYNYVKEEIFPSYLGSSSEIRYNPNNLNTPLLSKLKRKASNYYLGRIIQPRFMKKVKFGY